MLSKSAHGRLLRDVGGVESELLFAQKTVRSCLIGPLLSCEGISFTNRYVLRALTHWQAGTGWQCIDLPALLLTSTPTGVAMQLAGLQKFIMKGLYCTAILLSLHHFGRSKQLCHTTCCT